MNEKLIGLMADLQEDETIALVHDLVKQGVNPMSILDDARLAMEAVGKRFEKCEYFIPDLMMAGEILKGISDIVKPLIEGGQPTAKKGKVLIGTVAGDIHDIGKDIVTFMLDVSGYDVLDIGIDVPVATFVEKIRDFKPQVVGMSGFLTLAFDSMKKTVSMRVLNAAQMREADRRTIEEIGIPSLVLMENAGRQVVAAIEAVHSDVADRRVAVLCGRGNNGGDGFVVARTLLQRGVDVSVFLIGQVSEVRGDARINLEILGRLGLTVVEIADSEAWELHFSEVGESTLIVDAIFGTGLNAPLSGLMETVVADVNGSGIPIVAIDLPSGLSADSHKPIGASIEAGMTVTLAAPKLALVLPPAENRVGDVVIADIGIPAELIESLDGPRVELLTRASMRELITPRAADSHKGDYGRVLIVAGSRGKTGAAHLAAIGALRSGAGLVTVATPACCLPVVASLAPEYMTEAIPERGDGLDPESVDHVVELARDVIAIGPGLGQAPSTQHFIRALVDRATMPIVVDADGLNAFGADPDRLSGREGRDAIITPHPGEMARLVGMSTDEVQASRLEVARNFAVAHHLYVVLKGHRTLIATPDGKVFINPTGNAGMATGGTGDVLTGMIAAWLAQLLDAEAACKLAVYLHGMAGDLAEADEGEVSLVASDVVGHLGDAIMELTARRKVVDRNGDRT